MRKGFLLGLMLMIISTTFSQSSSKAVWKRGEEVYSNRCVSCHQQDGTGIPQLNPPLAGTETIKGSKTYLIQWMLNGSPNPKKSIDGVYYSNFMPSQADLSNEDIAAVLTYVRKSFGNNFSAITSAEVKSVRTSIKK